MCTLSILRNGARTLVTMNRDEARNRAPELPIQRFANGTLEWAAPIDGEAMGTWMGANSAGLVACLMNTYETDGPEDETKRSRGAIVLACLAEGGLAEASAWAARALRPERYRPFRLVLIDGGGGTLYASTGADAIEKKPLIGTELLFASSSWRSAETIAWRDRAFAAWAVNGRSFEGETPSFHLAAPGDDPRFAAMMARNQSCTRSVTQAEIAGDGCTLRYWPVRDRRLMRGESAAVGR